MRNVNLTSLEGMLELLISRPQLLTIPAFQSLRPLVEKASLFKSRASCCGEKLDLQPYRRAFEAGLNNLTAAQKTQIKSILGVDQVSYFVRVGGIIQQRSF